MGVAGTTGSPEADGAGGGRPLTARGPFRLPVVVESHGWHQTAPFRWDPDAGVLERREALAGGPATIRVIASDGGVQVSADRPLDDADAAGVERRARRMLQLDADLEGFLNAAHEVDPLLAEDLARAQAGRLLAGGSIHEDVTKAICGTNTTWRGAVLSIGRIAAWDADGTWPGPEVILRAGDDALRAEARVGYRAAAITDAARAAIEGRLDAIERHSAGGDAEAVDRALLALRGVGPATVGFLRLLLGHYDVPFVDSATIRYATRRWYDGRRPTPRELVARVAPAGRFAGLTLFWATMESWRRELDAGRAAAAPEPAAGATGARRRPRSTPP